MKSAIWFFGVLAALVWIATHAASPAANLIAIWMAVVWVILWAWRKFAWHD